MAITVTAAQGGSTAASLLLRVFVLTGAKTAASQTGASTNNQFASVTAFTQSITTTAGSNVYGAASHGSGVTDSGSNTTVVDSSDDNTNGWHYTTFKALNVTSGATTRGVTVSLAQSGPFAQLEILAQGTLAEDASAPAAADGTGTAATSVTTASFTPPAGSLLVALVASDGGATVTTMTVSDSSSLSWTEKVKNNPSGGDYAGVWIADVPAAAGSVTWVPQRYGQAAAVSPVPWAQRDRRDANTAGTAANPLVTPLDAAWQADAQYSHLYSDSHLRDRRQYFYQRPLVSDPNLLGPPPNADPLALNPEQSSSSDLWRVAAVPAFCDRREVPQQRQYYDVSLLATAELENELLGGAETGKYYRTPATHAPRWWMPQQRGPVTAPDDVTITGGAPGAWWSDDNTAAFLYGSRRWYSDPSIWPAPNPLDPLLTGQDYLDGHQHQAATHYDRREVPQQRLYISDPSFYPTAAATDPLTVAWGAGGNYWHLYNRADDITDRREYPAQRPYISDPLLLTTALLENELLGGADVMRHYLAAAYTDRREVPQQRLYISDPSFYPTGAVTDPLTVAWGAGGSYWHLYNRASDATDRREVPQQRAYISDPLLLTTALLENELLGGAGTAQRYGRPAYYDRREVPQQRGPVALVSPPVPFDPLLAAWADLARRYGLAATHADRRLYPQQRLYFPVPLPPPPFTIGALTAADAALGALTATLAAGGSGGALTATDQRTGGPA